MLSLCSLRVVGVKARSLWRASRDRQRRSTLALLLALLAGCTGGIRPGIDDQRHWQLSGKIGLNGPNMAESAYLNWRQCGDEYDMRLSTPLGQTVAHIVGQDNRLTITFNGHEPVTTAEPEQLLQQQLGWSVPLRALRYWVRAEAVPAAPVQIDGSLPQPQGLSQLGWQVLYPAYHLDKSGPGTTNKEALPAKLILRGAEGVQITLLIKDWLLSDAVVGCNAPQ